MAGSNAQPPNSDDDNPEEPTQESVPTPMHFDPFAAYIRDLSLLDDLPSTSTPVPDESRLHKSPAPQGSPRSAAEGDYTKWLRNPSPGVQLNDEEVGAALETLDGIIHMISCAARRSHAPFDSVLSTMMRNPSLLMGLLYDVPARVAERRDAGENIQ